MKIKKILSSVVAAVMAVTTFSAFSTTVTAETLTYTGTWDEYNTINYSFDITALADTDAISATVYDSTVEEAAAYPSILFQLSDSNTDWGNDCYINKPITDDITEENAETITITVGELRAKYEEVVGSAWTSSTKLRFAFWNGGTANTTIEVDTDYVAPTTDVWVDNGDGSYTLTRGTSTSTPDLEFSASNIANIVSVSCNVSVSNSNGYANGGLQAGVKADAESDVSWPQKAWNESTSTVTYAPGGLFTTKPLFQVWYAPEGATITVSNIQVLEKNKAYCQHTSDGTAVRGVMLIDESTVTDYSQVKFTFNNGTKNAVVYSSKYFRTVTVGGDALVAPEGYVYVACAVKGIPEDVIVECTGIELIP